MKKERITLFYNSKKIKEVINERGFILRTLAKNVGLSYQALINILNNETGYAYRNISKMIYLCNEIGVDLNDMLDIERFKKDLEKQKKIK